MTGRTNNVTGAIPNRPSGIVSAGPGVRVRRDKGFATGFRNKACSNFGGLPGVLGATLMEPVVAEFSLTLRGPEVTTQKILAVPGAERLLKLANQLLGRSV